MVGEGVGAMCLFECYKDARIRYHWIDPSRPRFLAPVYTLCDIAKPKKNLPLVFSNIPSFYSH